MFTAPCFDVVCGSQRSFLRQNVDDNSTFWADEYRRKKKSLSALKPWTRHYRSGFIFVHPCLVRPFVGDGIALGVYPSLVPGRCVPPSLRSIKLEHSVQFLWTRHSLFLLSFSQQVGIHLGSTWKTTCCTSFPYWNMFIFFTCSPNHEDILLTCICHWSSCLMVNRCVVLLVHRKQWNRRLATYVGTIKLDSDGIVPKLNRSKTENEICPALD